MRTNTITIRNCTKVKGRSILRIVYYHPLPNPNRKQRNFCKYTLNLKNPFLFSTSNPKRDTHVSAVSLSFQLHILHPPILMKMNWILLHNVRSRGIMVKRQRNNEIKNFLPANLHDSTDFQRWDGIRFSSAAHTCQRPNQI